MSDENEYADGDPDYYIGTEESAPRRRERMRRAEEGYQQLIAPKRPRVAKAKTVMLSMRVSPENRDAIAQNAYEAGLSQSDYISRLVLGELAPEGRGAYERRLSVVEKRIARLERKAYGIELSDDEIDALFSSDAD
jgi:hypothetical protein